jgi:hypothetical protein
VSNPGILQEERLDDPRLQAGLGLEQTEQLNHSSEYVVASRLEERRDTIMLQRLTQEF